MSDHDLLREACISRGVAAYWGEESRYARSPEGLAAAVIDAVEELIRADERERYRPVAEALARWRDDLRTRWREDMRAKVEALEPPKRQWSHSTIAYQYETAGFDLAKRAALALLDGSSDATTD